MADVIRHPGGGDGGDGGESDAALVEPMVRD